MEWFSVEWLNLALRWMHLVFGIAWIGASFYFVWQDNNLEAAAEDPDRARLQGELWIVHGGGFYHVRKFKVAPPELPSHLHWFKWEAYATWLSGFVLLATVYWFGSTAMLLPADSPLTHLEGVAVGAGALAGTWYAYDRLCRSSLARHDWVLAAAVCLLVCVLAFALSQVLSGRAAFLHSGAALGTVMVANVFFVIIPNQRLTVEAMLDGEAPDPEWGRSAKQRSVHNTYLTLPVLFAMISNHYPETYSSEYSWLIFLGLAALGAGVRHVFLLRHHGLARPWMLPAAGAAFAALAIAVTTANTRAILPVSADTRPTFKVVQSIIRNRCLACHSRQPSFEGITAPPKGVMMETAPEIKLWAPSIQLQAVTTQAMPLGNVTGMTPEERAILGRWIADGAPVN